jgi:uncharacterized protein with von Willebrand factor type A (vWA) domain
MPRQQLHQALEALREALDSDEQIEPAGRKALLEAAEEIHEALERADSGSKRSREEPLSGRVSTMIGDFEASHPRFAEILRSLSESLANLGI